MKKLFLSLKNTIKQAWSLDTRSLSLFRVGIALVVIADLCLRSRYMIEHYTDFWLFPREALFSLENSKTMFSIHAANGQLWYQVVLFALHGFFALCMLVGYRTKMATILVWILTVSLQNRNMSINSGADDLLRLVLFWSMFLPLNRHWSWDSQKQHEIKRVHGAFVLFSVWSIAFIVQQMMLYWVTAYLKFGPEWYVTHTAVYEILALEWFRTSFGTLLYPHKNILEFLSWASMFTEFLAPLLLIFPFWKTGSRFLGIILIIGLHIGIVTTIGVGIFPWVSMISMLALLPSFFWDKILKKMSPKWELIVYYDDHCGLCARWIRVLRSYAIFSGVEYVWLSQAPLSVQKISQTDDAWVIARWRKYFLGYDGFVELTKQSWILRPYALIGRLFPLNLIGHIVYKTISKTRKFCEIPRPITLEKSSHIARIIGSIICAISLYIIIVINISVVSCGNTWKSFFRAWPMSWISILQERWFYPVESHDVNYGHGWWSWPGFLAPEKAKTCMNTAMLEDSIQSPVLKKLWKWHTEITWWWTFLPRIDQYWWMFAPNPLNTDYWMVIDADVKSKSDSTKIIKKDIWKEYALGDSTNLSVNFEKPDIHALSVADRWRKYITNIFEWNYDEKYVDYFARSLCQKYNNSESSETLEKFQIYKVWQMTQPGYFRTPIGRKVIWQHCCLKDGCFNETAPVTKP